MPSSLVTIIVDSNKASRKTLGSVVRTHLGIKKLSLFEGEAHVLGHLEMMEKLDLVFVDYESFGKIPVDMIKNILRVTNVLIMFRFGVIYIIYGEIVLSFLGLIINTYYTKRFVDYGLLEQLKDVAITFLVSIVLAILGFILIDLFDNDYLKIISVTLFIASFYVFAMYYLNKKLLFDTIDIIRSKLPRNKV